MELWIGPVIKEFKIVVVKYYELKNKGSSVSKIILVFLADQVLIVEKHWWFPWEFFSSERRLIDIFAGRVNQEVLKNYEFECRDIWIFSASSGTLQVPWLREKKKNDFLEVMVFHDYKNDDWDLDLESQVTSSWEIRVWLSSYFIIR